MGKNKRMIGIKIIAGIETALSGLLGYLFSLSGTFLSPFFWTSVVCFGMSLSVLFLRNRPLGIIFISVTGGLVLASGALFAIAIWTITAFW